MVWRASMFTSLAAVLREGMQKAVGRRLSAMNSESVATHTETVPVAVMVIAPLPVALLDFLSWLKHRRAFKTLEDDAGSTGVIGLCSAQGSA